jgi:hypothetical protein
MLIEDAEWGTHMNILSLAIILNRPVKIYTDNDDQDQHYGTESNGKQAITIGYMNRNHFIAILPKTKHSIPPTISLNRYEK